MHCIHIAWSPTEWVVLCVGSVGFKLYYLSLGLNFSDIFKGIYNTEMAQCSNPKISRHMSQAPHPVFRWLRVLLRYPDSRYALCVEHVFINAEPEIGNRSAIIVSIFTAHWAGCLCFFSWGKCIQDSEIMFTAALVITIWIPMLWQCTLLPTEFRRVRVSSFYISVAVLYPSYGSSLPKWDCSVFLKQILAMTWGPWISI